MGAFSEKKADEVPLLGKLNEFLKMGLVIGISLDV